MDYNKNKYFTLKGFTLLELLITLFIFSLLSFGGLYYNGTHPNKAKLSLLANQFYFDLSFAKEQAMLQQKMVSVCPIDPNEKWTKGYQIKILGQNQADNTVLLIRTPPYSHGHQIQAHFGLNQPCVYFDPTGQSSFNGHFLYAVEGERDYVKMILTQTGKMHIETS